MEPLLTFDTLRGAFDNMAEAVVIFDAQYTVLYQNHAALELNRLPTGITRSELEQVIERFKPDGAPLPVEDSPVSRALRGETVRDEEIHVHRKALGDTRVWIYNAVPIRDDSGVVVRAVLNVRDVTEQKRQQTELEQATRALKESNQDLERFASIAAHDLKEPLRIVASFSQLLAHHNEGKLDQESVRFVRHILNAVDRMDNLIHNLMEFSRVNAAIQRPFAPADCAVALGSALQQLQFKILEAGAKISFDRLPPVMGDEALLVQLFENLIGNAIKYCESTPCVHITASRRQNEWLFSVRDNGIGIAPEYHERIFGMFQRLHDRREYAGSGVGLAICKRIVERHGGRIWVESKPGNGADFRFTLPAST